MDLNGNEWEWNWKSNKDLKFYKADIDKILELTGGKDVVLRKARAKGGNKKPMMVLVAIDAAGNLFEDDSHHVALGCPPWDDDDDDDRFKSGTQVDNITFDVSAP